VAVKNLWGDIPESPAIRPPVAILKEQGDLLETLTKGLLEGRVLREQDAFSRTVLRFAIVAPALNNYTFVLLQVVHDIELYPANLKSIVESLTFPTCTNEDEFLNGLSTIFQSEKTKRVIAGLLAQIQQGT